MSRQIIRVTGEDRLDFLQDLVTNDVTRAPCWAALLTPQGKYLADFLILSDGDALLLDVDAGLAEDLLRRLGMYKLRSKVTFTDRTADFAVVAICGQDAAASAAAAMTPGSTPDSGAAWADARLDALGYRQLVPRGSLDAAAALLPPPAPEGLHSLLSSLLGVPDGAMDLPPGECVPHESNLELLGSIHFAKGCYLGQELSWG